MGFAGFSKFRFDKTGKLPHITHRQFNCSRTRQRSPNSNTMEFILSFLKNPISIAALSGLGVGLLLSLFILIKTRIYRRELDDEIADARYDYRRLEEQMNAQMRISAKAQDELQARIDEQQQRIHHLQTSLETLSQKPGKKELRQLQLYERTLELMEQRSPNAMLSWENAQTEALEQMAAIDKGLKPMLRKVFKSE